MSEDQLQILYEYPDAIDDVFYEAFNSKIYLKGEIDSNGNPVSVPVLFFAKHPLIGSEETEKLYLPSLLLTPLDLREASGYPVRVDRDSSLNYDKDGEIVSVTIREAPVWFEFLYQVTAISSDWRQFQRLSFVTAQGIIPKKYGGRYLEVNSINRTVRLVGQSYLHDKTEEGRRFRCNLTFSLTLPLYTTKAYTLGTIKTVILNFNCHYEDIEDTASVDEILTETF